MARILILTHEFFPFRGGICAVTHGLAAGAVEAGHDPTVFAPDYGGDHANEDEALPYRVRRFEGRTCSIVSARRLARYTVQCLGVLRGVDAEIVHAVDPAAHMALTMLGRFGFARDSCFTVHGSEVIRYRAERFPRLWMTGAFRRVRGVAAVSDAVRALFVAAFPEATARTFVSYPGIDPLWFRAPRFDAHAWRARLRVSDADIVILTLARRVPEKGQDRVISALALLPDSLRRRIVYVLAGDGPDPWARALGTAAAAAGVRLILLGPITDEAAIEVCDAADLFAMPSRRTRKRLEGLGLACLEAGARGLPCLATDTGGIPEAVRHDETGLLVADEADDTLLAEALRRLIEDVRLRRRLGENARAFASRFTWRRHAEEVYSRFLALRDAPGPRSSRRKA